MKKTIIAIFFSMGSLTAFSQEEPSAFDVMSPEPAAEPAAEPRQQQQPSAGSDLSFTSKNGHEVLPKAGDWALGIGASSILGYVGDIFNGTNNNGSPSFSETQRGLSGPSISIFGKKMVRDNYAYRASLDIFAEYSTTRFRVDDDNSSNPDDYLFDSRELSNYAIAVSGGFEHRRGRGRVQGIYGAEAYVFYSSGSTSQYNYANEITAGNQEPSGIGFGNPTGVPQPALGYRIVKADQDNRIEGGIRGFVGVEYFFAPQMSIGGEFFLGAGYTSTGGESVTYEGFDGATNQVREYTNVTEGSNGFSIGTDNAGGSVNLLFYF